MTYRYYVYMFMYICSKIEHVLNCSGKCVCIPFVKEVSSALELRNLSCCACNLHLHLCECCFFWPSYILSLFSVVGRELSMLISEQTCRLETVQREIKSNPLRYLSKQRSKINLARCLGLIRVEFSRPDITNTNTNTYTTMSSPTFTLIHMLCPHPQRCTHRQLSSSTNQSDRCCGSACSSDSCPAYQLNASLSTYMELSVSNTTGQLHCSSPSEPYPMCGIWLCTFLAALQSCNKRVCRDSSLLDFAY